MSSTGRLTGRLVAAARALTGISRNDLATAAGLPLETLALIKTGVWLKFTRQDLRQIVRLENEGEVTRPHDHP